MLPARTCSLTVLAMIAFAGNSLICRLALDQTNIDPASFTFVRVTSGALVLWFLTRLRRGNGEGSGNWISALSLFAYATGFSFAYVSLPTAVGALLLFGAVQATMIGYGLMTGERLGGVQTVGLIAAISGLVALLLPGLSAPPIVGAVLMLGAGLSWGVYSLRAKGAGDPLRVTAGNFQRSVVFAAGLSVVAVPWISWDYSGVAYAVISGAVTSGIGYAIWYTALRGLNATSAATVQLSVPVLAAAGGILFLHEQVTVRLAATSVAILGGIALVMLSTERATK